MTVIATQPAPGRWRHVLGHLRCAAWLAFHPSAPLSDGSLNIPVAPGERGARLLELKSIADRLGVTEQERDGAIVAERRFGPVALRAHLVARDHTRKLVAAGFIRKSGVLADAEVDAVRGWAGNTAGGAE